MLTVLLMTSARVGSPGKVLRTLTVVLILLVASQMLAALVVLSLLEVYRCSQYPGTPVSHRRSSNYHNTPGSPPTLCNDGKTRANYDYLFVILA